MRRTFAFAALALLLAACNSSSAPQELDLAAQQDHNRNFRAHLTGAWEVPPVDTRAQGQAIFQLSKDGSELGFKLIVANIENVAMAHIHQGRRA